MKYYLLLLTVFLNACSVVDTIPDSEVFYLNPDMFTDRKVSSTTEYTDEKGITKTLPWTDSSYDKIKKDDLFFSIYYDLRTVWIYDVDTRISYTDETKEITYEAPQHNLKYTLKIHNHRVTNIKAETITTDNLTSDMFTHTSPIKYTDTAGKTTSLQWTGTGGDKIEKNDPLFSVYYAHSDTWIRNIDTRVLYSDNTKEVIFEDSIHDLIYTLKIENRRVTDIRVTDKPLPPSTGKLTVEMFQHDKSIIYTYMLDFGFGPMPTDQIISKADDLTINSEVGNLTTITYNEFNTKVVIDTSISYDAPDDVVKYTANGVYYVITIVKNRVTIIDVTQKAP